MIDKNINQYCMKHILGEQENKSSFKFMSTPLCQFGKPHSTWSFVRDNPTDVQKAAIKTRILTGCYTLEKTTHDMIYDIHLIHTKLMRAYNP